MEPEGKAMDEPQAAPGVPVQLPDEGALPEGHRSGFVAVVGRPNAGKSTLLNTFLQEKVAIVTPRPQTTRTRQLGILTAPLYQMIFVDTPGIMKKPRHKLDEFMLQTARETLQDADVILWVADATTTPGAGDREVAQMLLQEQGHAGIILAINKSDLVPPERVMPVTGAYRALLPESPWLFISALEQRGTAELLAMLVQALPLGPRYYPADQLTDRFLRDIAAEMIREKVLLHVRQEVPHGVAVQVTEFKERANGTTYVGATIFVERQSHKRIIIGSRGAVLRAIGTAARQEIESMMQGKAYVELWVKVAPKWRQNERQLRRFGYAKQ